ncbi:MAG: hypothetical protein KDD22_02530 [Bdellovibrionales bacterium]|nr:hypothetical protein [Bdellovibrionales bacterium]
MSDGRLSLSQLIDLYGQRGFGAIAITDHLCEEQNWLGQAARLLHKTLTQKTFAQYLENISIEASRAWDEYRMIVIPGVEFTKNSTDPSQSAHFLALGISQWISPDQSVEAVLKEIKNQGAVSVAAHPVSTRQFEPQTFYLWDHRQDLHSLFDAWEVASGQFLFEEVRDSGLPLLANSDLHHPRQINAWKTRLNCERHPEAVLEAICDQDVDFVLFKERKPLFEPLRSGAWSWLSTS